MPRPQSDDHLAVLRRLERHGASTKLPEPDSGRRPGLSPRVVIAILTVFLVIAMAVWAPWSTGPHELEVPEARGAPEKSELPGTPGGGLASAQPEVSTPTAPTGQATPVPTPVETVTIHVTGRVKNPGVYAVPAGSRVIDAIEAAGGATDKADLTRLNLARIVHDEEFLPVLAAGEDPPDLLTPAVGGPGTGAVTEPGGGGAAASGGGGAEVSADVLNLNTATEEQLQTLPGVGPVMAERIVEWRTQNDGFRTVDELREVSGIGPKIFAKLADRVTV